MIFYMYWNRPMIYQYPMDLSTALNCVQVGGVVLGLHYSYKLLQRFLVYRAQNRWKNAEKDTVILHTVCPGKTIPNLSPYSMKLDTYLRMAGIKYQIDNRDAFFGPTGKFPWISLNGQHYSDSQLIIEMLGKKFEKNFQGSYSDEELASATAMRIMLEEHFSFGGVAMWRYVFEGRNALNKILAAPSFVLLWLKVFHSRKIATICWYQGVGRNTKEQIQELMFKDLKTLSIFLGKKKFLLGEEPCEDDCAVFGMLAQVMWAMPESPYQIYVHEELPNITEYCDRMKNRFWGDWQDQLAAAKARK